jgi:ubiquinone/menaquinone biosynthesis C-methylase UbiE
MTRYVEDTYAKIAQAYTDEFFSDTSDLPLINHLVEKLKAGSKVLDIGSGPGQFSRFLSDKGFAVDGIDNSSEMLSIARAKAPGITFTKMDMRSLSFPDECFDGILAAYSIIHIPTDELGGVLAEIRRVLKTGGYAMFIVQKGEADQVLDEPLAKGEKIFMNFFNTERLNDLLADAGFEIVKQGTNKQASEEVMSSEVIYTLVAHARPTKAFTDVVGALIGTPPVNNEELVKHNQQRNN